MFKHISKNKSLQPPKSTSSKKPVTRNAIFHKQTTDYSPEQLLTLQRTIGNRAVARLLGKPETATPSGTFQPIQRKNFTGMPDTLKNGVESLSGMAMDDVRVHYTSSRPADMGALAYTQGTNIYLGAGQEKHLPHEAWHVVQQKQGRATKQLQMKHEGINIDRSLEQEADVMGNRAAHYQETSDSKNYSLPEPSPMPRSDVIQAKLGFEFQTGWTISPAIFNSALFKSKALVEGTGWKLTSDDGEVEYVVEPPIEEGDYARLQTVFGDLRTHTNWMSARAANPQIDGSTIPGVIFAARWMRITPAHAGLPAKPQVTAGLRIKKIPKFMEKLGDPNTNANQTLTARRAPVLHGISGALGGIAGTGNYKGLVSLMATYVANSSNMQFVTTAKEITTIMSRSNFAQTVPYVPELRNPDHHGGADIVATKFLGDVLALALAAGGGTHATVDQNLRLIPQVADYITPPNPALRTGPTVKEWVDGLMKGQDLLAFSITNSATWRSNSISMGNINRLEAVDTNKPGLITEFRDLKFNNVTHDTWGDYAEKWLEWVTALNSGEDRDFPTETRTQRELNYQAAVQDLMGLPDDLFG